MILSDGQPNRSWRSLGHHPAGSPKIHLGGKFTLDQIEAEHIRRLIANHETLEQVAEILKIDPATLYRKRKRP